MEGKEAPDSAAQRKSRGFSLHFKRKKKKRPNLCVQGGRDPGCTNEVKNGHALDTKEETGEKHRKGREGGRSLIGTGKNQGVGRKKPLFFSKDIPT